MRLLWPLVLAVCVLSVGACSSEVTAQRQNGIHEFVLPELSADEAAEISEDAWQDRRLDKLYRQLLDELEEDVRAMGAEPILDRQQWGIEGRIALLSAASPEGSAYFLLPFYGSFEGETIQACRFEIRPDELGEFPRVGEMASLAFHFRQADCSLPELQREGFESYLNGAAQNGYSTFAEAEEALGGSRAALITVAPDAEGWFSVDRAIDHWVGADREVERSIGLPPSSLPGSRLHGFADLTDGNRIFYFDEGFGADRAGLCIVEGMSWEAYRTAPRDHPALEWCMQAFQDYDLAESARLQRLWEENPPRIIITPPAN